MWNVIVACATSLLYCMLVVSIGYALALAAAPSALGVSVITLKSLAAWIGVSAVGAGLVSSLSWKFMERRDAKKAAAC